MKRFLYSLIILLLLTNALIASDESNQGLSELTIGQSLNSIFLTLEGSYALDLYYRQTVGLSILMLSAGIITPRIVTKNTETDISNARARNINSASLWSGSTGMLLGLSIDMVDFRTQSYLGFTFDVLATSSAAYFTSQKHLSADALSVVNSGGIWGLIMGYGVFEVVDTDIRYTPLFLLVGQLTGLGGSYYMAQKEVISRERQTKIDLYILFSGGVTYGLASLFEVNKSVKWALTCAGFIAGAWLGYRITDTWEKPAGYSVETELKDEMVNKSPQFQLRLPAFIF